MVGGVRRGLGGEEGEGKWIDGCVDRIDEKMMVVLHVGFRLPNFTKCESLEYSLGH